MEGVVISESHAVLSEKVDTSKLGSKNFTRSVIAT